MDGAHDLRVNEICGILNAQHAALVGVVAQLLCEPSEWQGDRVWTMPQWLAWRCGVSSATAGNLAVVAARVDELPVTMEAFRRGELSLDQVVAVARAAPAWADEQSCEYAKVMTVHQLRRAMSYPFDEPERPVESVPVESDVVGVDVVGVDSLEFESGAIVSGAIDQGDRPAAPGGAAPGSIADGSADGWVSPVVDDAGVFRLSAATDQETGRLFIAALTEARDALFLSGRTDVTWVDALREVAERSLASVGEPDRRSRFRVNVYLDVDRLAGGATSLGGDGRRMVDAGGWSVPDAIRRHLTCDGLLTPLFVSSGVPLSVGRSQRLVPARTRAVIERRDGGCCRVPGCTQVVGLEVHHIIHWEDDGPTDTWNLVLVCGHHHRRHHAGVLGITGNADIAGELCFTDRRGRPIRPSGADPHPPDGPPPPPAGTYEHPLGERFDGKWLHFNPPRVVDVRSETERSGTLGHPSTGSPPGPQPEAAATPAAGARPEPSATSATEDGDGLQRTA